MILRHIHKENPISYLLCFFPSGLPERFRQHHTGHSRAGDLLQVLLWEKIRPERIRVRPGGRNAQYGPRREAGHQT